jgi:photosystem II stability/assembly factor-like uncharacterized protein
MAQDVGFVEKDVGVVTGSWTDVTNNLLGVPSTCGNLTYVSSRPDKDELIAGVATVGLWASLNGAMNWTLLGQGDGGVGINNRTSQILFDLQHPGTFWQSGSYGQCVYRTTNDGLTFEALGNKSHCDSISVDFTDPARQTLLAGGHEGHALYLSRDGGSNFTDISASVPASAGNTDIALVIGPNEFLVGTYNGSNSSDAGPGSGIYRTIDGGTSWTQVHAGGIRSLPLVASDTNRTIYWTLYNGENQHGIVRSTDHGASWQVIPGSEVVSSQEGVEQSLVQTPDGRLIALLPSNDVVVSADQGASWTPEGPTIPVIPNGIAYSSYQNAIYVWHFDCKAGADPVPPQAVLKLDFR